ncbi:MAG: hypothetical protein A2033_04165 [Bacteroidetes bacterium GWA2_31_9]|nr:MAG: hypothetical protein A2033_04165 [Bacteroidetes bacterium GWA2_31_9]
MACGKENNIFEIKEYHIICKQSDLDNVYANFKEDTYIPITISYGSDTIKNAKLRVRGDTSREDQKKSLKIKLSNPFTKGGKKIINLNAEYSDKSYIRQFVSSLIMHETGVACFSAQYVKVYMNGKYYGLYLEIENIDNDFLKRYDLDKNANLYKAKKDGACLSIYDNYDLWEKKTNTDMDIQDLKQLVGMLDTISDKFFYDFLQNNFEYDNVISIVAVNMLVQNASTYYHNYYMYHDIYGNGKWQIFPWDIDKSLSYYSWKPYVFYETTNKWLSDNVLIEKMLINDKVRKDLLDKVSNIGETVFNSNKLNPIINKLQEILEDAVAKDNTDQIENIEKWKEALQREKDFISNQVNYIKNQLTTFPKCFQVMRINETQISPPVLRWNPSQSLTGKNISYTVYYGTDYLFENKGVTTIIENVVDTFFVIPKTIGLGKYFWKIIASDGQNKVDGFNRFNFFIYKAPFELKSDITKDVTLDKEHSPYFITNSINVSKDVKLVINAGADIILKEGVSLTVHGSLIINGEKNNIVTFRPEKNEWGEIYMFNGSAEINYTNFIEGVLRGKESKIIVQNSSFKIKNKNLLYGGYRQAIIWIDNGEFIFRNSNLFGNGLGEGMNINRASTEIAYSYFTNTPDAIEVLNVENGNIHHNFVENSPDDAVDMNGCKNILVEYNYLLNNNDKAVSVGTEEYGPSTNAIIRYNLVIGNGTAFSVKDSSNAHIYNNTLISNNTGFVAYLKNNPDLKLNYSIGGRIDADKIILYNCKYNDKKIGKNSSVVINNSISNKNEIIGNNNILKEIKFINTERLNYRIQNEGDNNEYYKNIGCYLSNEPFITIKKRDQFLILYNPNLFPVNINDFRIKVGKKSFSLPNYIMNVHEEILIGESTNELLKKTDNRLVSLKKFNLKGKSIRLIDNNSNLISEINE